MELTGRLISDQSVVKIRMPKFGTVKNMTILTNTNIMENYEVKENLLKTKIRHQVGNTWRQNLRQGIFEWLSLHPFPRYSGPFTGLIDGRWNYEARMYSSDSDKTFLFFVTFSHPESQKCGRWICNQSESTNRINPTFKVDSTELKLSGPASTFTKTIVYPCDQGKCSIECPCNLCTSGHQPCGRYCAMSPCKDCDQQCKNHKCDLDRKFNYKDSFHIPFYFENLDEEARNSDTNALIVYNWNIHNTFNPEQNFIKYSGIPRSCFKCQVDLLDHEIHHHVLHYRCKFCRKSLRRLKNNPTVPEDLLDGERNIATTDAATCAFCHKYFCDTFARKEHEKTEHILKEKPFKCNECSKSFASEVGLSHHQRQHMEYPKHYSCETCKKLFTSEVSLKRHIKTLHHSEDKKEIKCEECDANFKRNDILTRHLHEVHGQTSVNAHYVRQLAKPFKCDYCDIRFTRKEHLKKHNATSKCNEDELTCNVCFKKFANMKNKRRHFNTVHYGIDEKYKCEYCEKFFGRKDSLLKHINKFHLP